jgi:galactokinase
VPREPSEPVAAFAPGRVNLIGEHTDYNEGLALPFAIAEGTTVHAEASRDGRVHVRARDYEESDEFALDSPARAPGWRAFARGTVAELQGAAFPLVGAHLEIASDLPQGAGLSSSAALEVSLCLALLALGGAPEIERMAANAPAGEYTALTGSEDDSVALAGLCSRVENEWVGSQSGLLDQLASFCGVPGAALLIDFRTLVVEPIPLSLPDGWRLVRIDSGERHANASSAYNERRAQCARASEQLGLRSLRDATPRALAALPEPLRRRARHVLGENTRVLDTVAALREGDLPAVGALLSASHASLRDDYEVSTPALDAAVERLLAAGAAGARLVGGGFGGQVLGLLPPGVDTESLAGAREVRASAGARLLATPARGSRSR